MMLGTFTCVAVGVTRRYADRPMTDRLGRRPHDVWLALISNRNG
jgi:hypothetical protein